MTMPESLVRERILRMIRFQMDELLRCIEREGLTGG